MAPKQEFGNSLDLVNIKEIKGNTVVMNDGSLRQIIMVRAVNFALKSDTEQNIITQAYQSFLNGIDFPLQIVIHSRKVNIEKYVEDLLMRKESEESALLQSQIDEYAEFIKGFVQKNAIMEKLFLVVIPFYPVNFLPNKKSTLGFLPFLGKKEPEEAASREAAEADRAFQENISQLGQRVSQALNGLASIGLETTVLTDEALTELFYNFYNPQTTERKKVPIGNAQ